MNEVHVVVPYGIDDPRRPSGGNVYDRRACRGLAALGWSVHEHTVPGRWPRRQRLSDWAQTSRELSAVLSEVAR